MIELAISLGLLLSLIFNEAFGLATGGLVVPGYIALQLGNPGGLIGILLVSLATCGTIKLVSTRAFVFGRRQLVLCVLVGCVFAIGSRRFLDLELSLGALELQAVGWVVPGLIANWFLKQGITRTLCSLIIASTLVRLLVILCFGGQLLP